MPDGDSRRRMMWGAFEEALDEQGFAPPGYEVSSELARGGMAVVYLARQLRPEREVALKVVLPKFSDDAEVQERFQREGRAMARLEHPHILPVYQVGEWNGLAYFTMKLARGGTLQDKLGKGLPDPREAVGWVIAAGEAVHFAHQQGVLHRDIKPGNLLFDRRGDIVVGDFGVARMDFASDGALTRTEALVGTPNYLAPEVASGVSPRGSTAADQYGLGAVLYECLSGKRPHEGAENLAAQLRAVVEEEVRDLRSHCAGLDRDLEVICGKALAKDPAHRYATVADFVEDLRRWQEGREILARPASWPERIARWSKRHPLPAILAALLIILATVGSALLFENYHRRGELLHQTLLEQARAERLLREPGFRDRVLGILREAQAIRNTDRIREEAIAALAYWDVGDELLPEHKPDDDLALPDDAAWLSTAVLRCPPAKSVDGRFLAMVQGERMEVVIYDLSRNKEYIAIPLREWPQYLRFRKEGEVLQVCYATGRADWYALNGELLLGGVSEDWDLQPPVGFSFWSNRYLSPVEAGLYGGSLSPSERLLATTSAVGVQIWEVDERRAADFYEVENQRIDAPTDAWWLSETELLIQVPGALEVVTVSARGQILGVRELERVPGTKIRAVTSEGDWIAEVRDEEGGVSSERWLGGDFRRAEDWQESEEPEEERASLGQLTYQNWGLILPGGREAMQMMVLEKSERLIVFTSDYRVAEWDLDALRTHLSKEGF